MKTNFLECLLLGRALLLGEIWQFLTFILCPEALKLYRGKLTAFEQTEILDYPEIWFLGLEAKKIEGEPGSAQNNGYDDDNGSYIKVIFCGI